MHRPLAAIAGCAIAVLALTACLVGNHRDDDAPTDFVHMQIVAHEDDDFLFMNPDLRNTISAGHAIVTVYLTAGQASGAKFGHPHHSDYVEMCAAEFATARQNGIKAAYAQMANVAAPTWTRHLIVPDEGQPWPHTVEEYTLDQEPRIQLLFMNLPDGGSQVGKCPYEPYANVLATMFDDPTQVTDTIQPSCGEIQGYGADTLACDGEDLPNPFVCNSFAGCSPTVPWQNYDHAGVVAVLTGLVAKYQPTVIRTLDPLPFSICDTHPCAVRGDNTDHTAAARFTDEVIAAYHGPKRAGRLSVVHYKGYSFADYPTNLGHFDAMSKRDTAMTYKPHDPNYRSYAKGYDGFYAVSYERYPASTQWIERADDGRLVAVTVEDRQVQVWAEDKVGGAWTGPVTLPTPTPVAPNVSVLRRPDGQLEIFAMQLPLERETWSCLPPGVPGQDILTAVQAPGAAIGFGAWQSLGAPGPAGARLGGGPTAVFDGSGRAFVFAKDSDGKIEYTASAGTGAAWAAWAPIAASELDIIDGIAAIARDDGGIEVFATGRDGQIQHFVQSGAAFVDATASFPFVASSAPTAAKNQDGRIEIFYREITDVADMTKYGRVITAWRTADGSWEGGIAGPGGVLYGDGGIGPVAAIRREGTGPLMVFERNGDGRVSATWQLGANGGFQLQWAVPGAPGRAELIQEYPAATTDSLGRAVLIVKGSDGRLYIDRERSASLLGSFRGWTAI